MDKLILGAVYLSKGLIYGLVIYIVILLIIWITKFRKRKINKIQYLIEYIFIVYAITLLQITGIANIFSWNFVASKAFNWIPFADEDASLVVLNALLFLPLGFLLPAILRLNWNCLKIGLFGAGVSLLIEMIQLFLVGRTADIDDILANTGGCIIGYALFCAARKVFRNNNKGEPVGLATATGILAPIILFFCVPWAHVCLGDVLLMQLSIPSWSGNTKNVYSMEGLHYTVAGGILIVLCLMIIAKKQASAFGAKTGFWISAVTEAILLLMMCMGY